MQKQHVISLAISLGIPMGAFCEETPEKQEAKTQKHEIKEVKKEARKKREKAYFEKKLTNLENAYIPILRDGVSLWIHADLLYFVPIVRNMAYTDQPSQIPFTTDYTQTKLVRPEYQWAPGFQIGFGYLFARTHWDVTFNATHYHTRVDNRKAANANLVEGMFPVWSVGSDIIPGDYVTEATFKGKLIYESLRLDAGYFWSAGSRFVFKLSAGLQNIWLKQDYNANYTGGVFTGGTDYNKLKNNFWGIGPRLEISPWLLLGKGWNLYGKAAAAYLGGIFNVRQKETYQEQTRFNQHSHFTRGRFLTDVEAGIQWKCLFYHERFSFATLLGWEYQVVYRQNMLQKDTAGLTGNGGVQIQGGVLSFRLDF